MISDSRRTSGWRLFALSFTALFLELMIIRWAPSQVRLVAYYANLMLVSSFLGLGVGALVARRGHRLFRWFAPLLALDVVILIAIGFASLPAGGGEWRFFHGEHRALGYVLLMLLFAANAACFVPLGEAIGIEFQRLPALTAYGWDLGGSLVGTVSFGAFSLAYFSPLIGIGIVVLLSLALSDGRQRRLDAVSYFVVLSAVLLAVNRRTVFWSPYYHISVDEEAPAGDSPAAHRAVRDPRAGIPANLRTMLDPPIYTVRVNQDFYQMHGTLDLRRYSDSSRERSLVAALRAQYSLPYQLIGKPDRVLVLGAGGGMDVEAALLHGARKVDAVEIDPVIAGLSSGINAAAPYADRRVVVHVDDARAFLRRNADRYDMVVFGFLDSQALFSYGASLRLDGYTYTVQSLRTAFAHVADRGLMSVSFNAGEEWMTRKLTQMIREATGLEPLLFRGGRSIIVIATRSGMAPSLTEFGGWRLEPVSAAPVDLATDDWPFLYLKNRGIPLDYAIVIGMLAAISIVAVVMLRDASADGANAHFLFMGWAFLLLQTKAIGDCSLYFGSTWVVTTLVITGVLLMILLANLVAARIRRFSLFLYVPLFAGLLVLFVPRDFILAYPLEVRAAWTLLAIPLPIFFAGLIFSTTFRTAASTSGAFGANLVGATIGGFSEYFTMWVGSDAMRWVIVALYGASLIVVARGRARRAVAALS